MRSVTLRRARRRQAPTQRVVDSRRRARSLAPRPRPASCRSLSASSLTASFSVTTDVASAPRHGMVCVVVMVGQRAARRSSRPASLEHREEALGCAMPAAATTRAPRSACSACIDGGSPRHQSRSARPRRPGVASRCSRASGVARLGGVVEHQRWPAAAAAGIGSRSGPAGSSQPLPTPRSSNTSTCQIARQAEVLQRRRR